jgi:hypothetical protein
MSGYGLKSKVMAEFPIKLQWIREIEADRGAPTTADCGRS